MLYKAQSKQTGNMWDAWLYHHEGFYYLFYLAGKLHHWDNISMARSKDGVHWTEIGPIIKKSPDATWLGTGSTWRSPNFAKDGKFQINFSEWKGPRQNIYFAQSTDLLDWQRLEGEEFRFEQDLQWYEREGRWDYIWTLPRPDGSLYGYWTGSPKPETGGQFGFGESKDGIHWNALHPPKVNGIGHGEVGAIERIGDKYYMLFGNCPKMTYLIADDPRGPFNPGKKNLDLLSHDTYFTRFFSSPDGLLVCHHAIARDGEVSFAPLKKALVDKEGTLRLGWWPGNEKMKHEELEVDLLNSEDKISMLDNEFDAKNGIILEGVLHLPDKSDDHPRGLYIEYDKEQGVAILFDFAGRAEYVLMDADEANFEAEQKIDREMLFEKSSKFRLLLKGSLVECYLSDVLIECHSLPKSATGRLGLIQGTEQNSIGMIRAWK